GDAEYDSASKLYYHDARWRDGARFISYDSFEADLESPLSLHKYLYAGANPVLMSDSNGNEYSLANMMVNIGIGFVLGAVDGYVQQSRRPKSVPLDWGLIEKSAAMGAA